jgi:hypothetical protein
MVFGIRILSAKNESEVTSVEKQYWRTLRKNYTYLSFFSTNHYNPIGPIKLFVGMKTKI